MTDRLPDIIGAAGRSSEATPSLIVSPEGQMNTGDPFLDQAIREIYEARGVKTSAIVKKKSLFKFGRGNSGGSGVKTTISSWGTGNFQEIFPTSDAYDSISSTDNTDDSFVSLEGHTKDSEGFTFTSRPNLQLTGHTPLTFIPTSRITRGYVPTGSDTTPAKDLKGDVYVFDSSRAGGTTNGVPNNSDSIALIIKGSEGRNQSEKAASTMSKVDYYVVTQIGAKFNRDQGSAANVDFDLEYKELNGVWRPIGLEETVKTSLGSQPSIYLGPYRWIAANTDFALVGIADALGTNMSAWVNGYLVTMVEEW